MEYNTPFNVTYFTAAAVKNYTGLDLGNFTGYLLEYIKLMLPEWNMSWKKNMFFFSKMVVQMFLRNIVHGTKYC